VIVIEVPIEVPIEEEAIKIIGHGGTGAQAEDCRHH
jgi:hypothetical protein